MINKIKKETYENLGKLKSGQNIVNKRGKTTVKPFNLRLNRRIEERRRNDCPGVGEKRNTIGTSKFVI